VRRDGGHTRILSDRGSPMTEESPPPLP
jgi:hypothetical protein